jgi:molybdenum cofactor guanylyltransferase
VSGESLSAAILAGGQSRRMGRDKARLELGGQTLIERVLAAVAPLNCPAFLVARQADDYARFGLPVVPDLFPGAGPLGGLGTALRHASAPALLLLACDLPFLTPAFLRFLAAQLGTHQAAVPRSPEGLQPLCAAYARSCLPAVEAALARGERRMHAFCQTLDLRALEPEEWQPFDPRGLLFANLNTPEEYRRACEALAED